MTLNIRCMCTVTGASAIYLLNMECQVQVQPSPFWQGGRQAGAMCHLCSRWTCEAHVAGEIAYPNVLVSTWNCCGDRDDEAQSVLVASVVTRIPTGTVDWRWHDHDIPACSVCGAETYKPPCSRCGTRFCSTCQRNGALCQCHFTGPRNNSCDGCGAETSNAPCEACQILLCDTCVVGGSRCMCAHGSRNVFQLPPPINIG